LLSLYSLVMSGLGSSDTREKPSSTERILHAYGRGQGKITNVLRANLNGFDLPLGL